MNRAQSRAAKRAGRPVTYDRSWESVDIPAWDASHPPTPLPKGERDGTCNRTDCSTAPATAYNRGTNRWYCLACAHRINDATREDTRGQDPLCAIPDPDEIEEAMQAQATHGDRRSLCRMGAEQSPSFQCGLLPGHQRTCVPLLAGGGV